MPLHTSVQFSLHVEPSTPQSIMVGVPPAAFESLSEWVMRPTGAASHVRRRHPQLCRQHQYHRCYHCPQLIPPLPMISQSFTPSTSMPPLLHTYKSLLSLSSNRTSPFSNAGRSRVRLAICGLWSTVVGPDHHRDGIDEEACAFATAKYRCSRGILWTMYVILFLPSLCALSS